MLTAEENAILTEVGPDKPMGRMMRRFWTPICMSRQVKKDGTPFRARLLGENFVVFRDSEGEVGALDEYCMHRGVSLALGRNEKGGLRCLYHGWKFAVDGTILETPNHCNDRFRQRLKAPAYPVREAGGLVWAYIGPKEKIPPFQHFAFMDGPEENRVVLRVNANANYLQLFEGGCDSSHVGILHSNMANPTWMNDEFTATDEDFNPGALAVADNAPTLDIEDTEYGYHYVAKRQGPPREDGAPTHSIRVTPVILPTGRVIPARAYQFFLFETPQDDRRTSTYLICHGDKPVERAEVIRIMGLNDDRFWNDEQCDFEASWDNHLGQNREAMKQNWSGYRGIEQEDMILAISMGPIIDRTKEHLVAADRAVVHLRARLLESVRLDEAGKAPIGLQVEDFTHVRSLPDTVIALDESWRKWVPNNMAVAAEPEMV